LNHVGAAAGLSDLARNAFIVRSLTPAPVVRILRPVLRGAGLIKNSSQQSLILLISPAKSDSLISVSFHLSCEI
jgi:hypothetical protein